MTETLITSSVLIVIIIILRTAFKGRVRSTVRYALWLAAAVRLMMPFSLAESPVSVMNFFNGLIPAEQTEISAEKDREIFTDSSSRPASEIAVGNIGEIITENPLEREISADVPAAVSFVPEVPEKTDIKKILRTVHLSGAAVMMLWFCAVNILFYRRLRRSRTLLEYSAPLKVYKAAELGSPCIFGIFKPSVYIPESAADKGDAVNFVIAHEMCHYYHGDVFWTFLRYFLLAYYWFDPFVWAAAVISKRDCEYACDESVIRRMGEEKRFEYGKAIIALIPRKGGELFGVASTSMSSGAKVIGERLKLIAAKPKNSISAAVCSAAVIALTACCTFTAAEKKDAVPMMNIIRPEEISAVFPNVGGSSGINVRDYTGAERTLYYIPAPERGLEPYLYMDNGGEAPAMKGAEYSAEGMYGFTENSRFSKADIVFGENRVSVVKSARPEVFDSLITAVRALSPEYTDIDITGRPIAEISFSRENGGFSSVLDIEFYNVNGGIAARVTADDYSGLVAIAVSENEPTEEEIIKAYNSSVHTVYFGADSTELYSLIYGLSGAEELDGIKSLSYEGFGTDIFSADIAEKLEVTGEIPEGYIMREYGNIVFGVPYDGSENVIGGIFLWQSDEADMKIFKDRGNIPAGAEALTGTFCGHDCIYYETAAKKEIGLIFSDNDGNIYTAVFGYRTDGAAETVKKISGSFHALPKTENTENIYVPPVALSGTPSIYGDENYDIAYGYGCGTYPSYTPCMLTAEFYITDSSKKYETSFDCFIERKEPDGKWYAVLPLGEIIQANSGYGHFYTKNESAREHACLDLSCYPPLPSGEYRLVKPFREAGGSDNIYAAMCDFYMSDDADREKELLCTAECTEKEISPYAESIEYEVVSSKILFAMSDIVNIERETEKGWVSARRGAIHTNSLHSEFPLAAAGKYTVSTKDFDISGRGNYRVRISYGEPDKELDVPPNAYDTAYAYFSVK